MLSIKEYRFIYFKCFQQRILNILLLVYFLLGTILVRANDSDQVNCPKAYKIVILGSSTSYGYGATPIDSSWANQYTAYVKRKNSQNTVINLGIPGFTTYNALCPDGYTPPANRPAPTSGFNITAALSYHPDAIIINLPTNDIVNNIPVDEQKANYERTMHLADSAHIIVWVTTTQPRNFLTTVQADTLKLMRDWTYQRFGNKTVDFWTTVSNPDGSINNYYDYDYAHVNNLGHDIFYQRMMAANILDTLCNRMNQQLIARAGNDTTIFSPASSVTLNGSASSDGNGTITGYQWSKISGPSVYTIASPNNSVTTVSNLVAGNYSFVLHVTDDHLAGKSDTINVIVSNHARVLIDLGLTNTASPDYEGKYWNNMNNAQPGIQVSHAITTTNTITNINLEVVNRIDGTFNTDGPGVNTGNSAGQVGDYPATATTDYAFAYPDASNGNWKLTGLDSTKQYTVKFWGTKTVNDTRIIQIKRSTDTVWQEYDAGMNSNYNQDALFVVTGKSTVSFDIRVKSGNAFGYISVIDIDIQNYTNQNPVANAGNDSTILLPANSLVLKGTGSFDPDGQITFYHWSKIAGPSGSNIATPDSSSTMVSSLIEGVYSFQLMVTDNSGASQFDTVTITVSGQKRILIDLGLTPTNSPDFGGKYWNNMTSVQNGNQLLNAITTSNNATSISLEVLNRIDGTFNPGGPGENTGNTAGQVGDYPSSATTDYAFADPSTNSGAWKIAGLDSLKQYTIKFWGTKTVNDNRIIQIKLSTDSTWKEYDAGMNTDYNNAAIFNFTGKSAVIFDIRVKTGSAFAYISVIDIQESCQPVTPSITLSLNTSGTICRGSHQIFTATVMNGGNSPVFQWTKNGVFITGANASTFSSDSLQNNDTIRCILTSNAPCATVSSITSNGIITTIQNCTTALQLKMYLQGYYISNGLMRPVLKNQGIGTNTLLTDTIVVELHHSSDFHLISSQKAILQTDGTVMLQFPSLNATYYIAILHRNSITTWSSAPVSFNTGSTTIYDFSNAGNKAFGNNLYQVSTGVWAIYTGDLNQDENIDAFDFAIFAQDLQNGINNSYKVSDLNGDGIVDATDYGIFESNHQAGVYSIHP